MYRARCVDREEKEGVENRKRGEIFQVVCKSSDCKENVVMYRCLGQGVLAGRGRRG